MMQMHEHRVINEHVELQQRIGSLAAFIECRQFASLPQIDQDLQTRQLVAMRLYSSILTERIARFKP